MSYKKIRLLLFSLIIISCSAIVSAQNKTKHVGDPDGFPVLWRKGKIRNRDLYLGPGGKSMKPDLTSVTFIKNEKHGHNPKFRIKDGAGREWVAKLGKEAQPETVAVRLLWALGYVTEINYLVPILNVPGKGTLKNVRLEARPEGVKRLESWKWRHNPFLGTNELQGLKIMMVFFTNWDLLDLQNKILREKRGEHVELQYVISDLGATFGRMGNNCIPIFYRLGRKTNDPVAWSKAPFIKGVKGERLKLAATGQKSFGLMKDVTISQGRWLLHLLRQLSDKQWRDAFRAANYSPSEIEILTNASKRRIDELEKATESGSLAASRKRL